MTAFDGHMDQWQSADFWKLIAGDLIGEGVYRRVFHCTLDPSLVIKVEREPGKFCNVMEFATWNNWQHCLSVADWLAPCVSISPNGLFMLQRKTTPLNMDRLPTHLPRFLTDRKTGNYGMLGKRVVCHDYAFTVSTFKEHKTRVRWTDA